jgi:hypothetical protein
LVWVVNNYFIFSFTHFSFSKVSLHDNAIYASIDEECDPLRDSLHDLFVLVGVLVPVIDGGDTPLAVILNSVHRIATEAEAGDGGAVGSSQVVWRGTIDFEV